MPSDQDRNNNRTCVLFCKGLQPRAPSAVGGTHLLLSGQYAKEAQKILSGSTVWTEETIFPDPLVGRNGEGFTLTAAHPGGTSTHHISVLCGESVSTVNPETETGNNRKQDNNQDQQQRRRDRRRDAKKKQQDRRRAK